VLPFFASIPSREMYNVMSFSLNAAEQSLAETQPQTIEKLKDGRAKRIRMLEQALKDRKRDIDQRSAETNAVSSTHLEGFQNKSVQKMKVAEEETKTAVEALREAIALDIAVGAKCS
jgi:F0F1-type ATP synthase membrane subunit b/b'